MKKKLLLLATVFTLLLSLTLPVFATADEANPSITFSEDFKIMYLDGHSFSRTESINRVFSFGGIVEEDDYYIYGDEFYEYDSYSDDGYNVYNGYEDYYSFELTTAQQELVSSVKISSEIEEKIFDIAIHYKDGAVLNVTFIRDDYLKEYKALLNTTDSTKMYIDFSMSEFNILKFEKGDLKLGKEEVIETSIVDDYFEIYAYFDGSTVIYAAQLIEVNGDYYYLDTTKPECDWSDGYYVVYQDDSVKAQKITNAEIIEKIEEGVDSYYGDSMNYIYDSDLLEGASKVILTAVLLILPIALFVVFLVLTIKAKEPKYRKLYIVITIIAVIQIILFFVTRYVIFK